MNIEIIIDKINLIWNIKLTKEETVYPISFNIANKLIKLYSLEYLDDDLINAIKIYLNRTTIDNIFNIDILVSLFNDECELYYINSNTNLSDILELLMNSEYKYHYNKDHSILLTKDIIITNLINSIESELLVKCQVIKLVINPANILNEYERVKKYHLLIDKYNLTKSLITISDLSIIIMIDNLSFYNKEELLNNLEIKNVQYLNDGEVINTIKVMLDNNLSISKTSNSLYIHRNTLIYRLDKIEQKIGVDLTSFSDALRLYLYLLLKSTK